MSEVPATILAVAAPTLRASGEFDEGPAIESREILRRNLAALRSAEHITGDEEAAWIDSFVDRDDEPGPPNQEATAEREIAAGCPDGPGPFAPLLLLGVTPPWAIRAAWRRANETSGPCRRRFVVVHEDVPSLLSGLSRLDLTGPAQDEFFDWFCGPTAQSRFAQWCESRLHLRRPERIVASANAPANRTLASSITRIVQDAAARQSDRERAVAERLRARYAGRTALDARRILQDAVDERRSLNILLFSSRSTTFIRHSIASLAEAFRASGHTAEIVEEPDAASAFTGLAYSEAIDRLDPDLLILPNLPRGAFGGAIPEGVPCVCWLQDAMAPAMNAEVGRSQGELDITAGNTMPELFDVYGFPRLNALPYPVPACPRRFHSAPISAEQREGFECDIAFVSHHGEAPEAMRDRFAREMDGAAGGKAIVHTLYDAARELVDTAARQSVAGRLASSTRAVLEKLGGSEPSGAQVSLLVHQLLLPLAGRIFRHLTLRMATRIAERRGWRLRLFGRGWDRSPEFAKYAAGPVEHGEDLRACYQAAGVHLHADLNTLTHQRVIECALSGGLPLCRLHADVLQPAAPAAQFESLELSQPTRIEPDGTRVYEHPSTPRASEYARQRRRLGATSDDTIRVPTDLPRLDDRVREVVWGPFDVCALFGDVGHATFTDEPSLEMRLEELIEHPDLRVERIETIVRHVERHLTTDVFARRLLVHSAASIGLASWCHANGRTWPPEDDAWLGSWQVDRTEDSGDA